MNKVSYQKQWISIADQLKKLRDRGLIVADESIAKRRLQYINYYRFAGYALKLQHWDALRNDRVFNDGVSFDDVWGLCLFDRDLRDVFSEALELVEISLRSCIAYCFAKSHGPFGHTDPVNFAKGFNQPSPSPQSRKRIVPPFRDWMNSIHSETQRSSEIFVKHFEQCYTEYPDLPIWVVGEICSFGTLSKMYSNMLNTDQGMVSSRYDLQYLTLESWIHSLTYVRNICAHHARLWDKIFQISPSLPKRKNWQKLQGLEKTVFVTALMLNWLLAHDSIDVSSHEAWKHKLEELMDGFAGRYPRLLSFTGFSRDWKKNPLWWQY